RGSGQEQITQVGGDHAHTLVLGLLPQAHTHVDVQTHQNAGSPRPTHRVLQPPVGGTAPVDEVEVGCDRVLVTAAGDLSLGVGLGGFFRHQGEGEDLLLLPPVQGKYTVGGQFGEGFGEVEVVGELGADLFLA